MWFDISTFHELPVNLLTCGWLRLLNQTHLAGMMRLFPFVFKFHFGRLENSFSCRWRSGRSGCFFSGVLMDLLFYCLLAQLVKQALDLKCNCCIPKHRGSHPASMQRFLLPLTTLALVGHGLERAGGFGQGQSLLLSWSTLRLFLTALNGTNPPDPQSTVLGSFSLIQGA